MSIIGAGTHQVTIESTALTQTKAGADQIAITFVNETGDRIMDFLSLTERAWQYTDQKLKACGFTGGANVDQLAGENSPIVGASMQITVAVESDPGYQPRPRVKFYGPPSGPKGVNNPASVAAALRARLGLPPAEKVPF